MVAAPVERDVDVAIGGPGLRLRRREDEIDPVAADATAGEQLAEAAATFVVGEGDRIEHEVRIGKRVKDLRPCRNDNFVDAEHTAKMTERHMAFVERGQRPDIRYALRRNIGAGEARQADELLGKEVLAARRRQGLVAEEGIDRERFLEQTGFELDRLVGPALASFTALGLLHDDGQRVKLSREGLFVSDSIWPHFLKEGKT